MFDLDAIQNTILNFDICLNVRRDAIDNMMGGLGFIFIGEGRHRRTYLSPNKRFVLKFPHCRNGLEANQMEAGAWKNSLNSPGIYGNYKFAPCRLIHGAIVMMMAVVKIYGGTDGCHSARNIGIKGKDYCEDYTSGLPGWCHDIDATQVGVLRNGKLVAYDYADDC